jgi:hypothetical protein
MILRLSADDEIVVTLTLPLSTTLGIGAGMGEEFSDRPGQRRREHEVKNSNM